MRNHGSGARELSAAHAEHAVVVGTVDVLDAGKGNGLR